MDDVALYTYHMILSVQYELSYTVLVRYVLGWEFSIKSLSVFELLTFLEILNENIQLC